MHDDDEVPPIDTDKPKTGNNPKPDKTTRKKLEVYLEELELKRQLNDWGDKDED